MHPQFYETFLEEESYTALIMSHFTEVKDLHEDNVTLELSNFHPDLVAAQAAQAVIDLKMGRESYVRGWIDQQTLYRWRENEGSYWKLASTILAGFENLHSFVISRGSGTVAGFWRYAPDPNFIGRPSFIEQHAPAAMIRETFKSNKRSLSADNNFLDQVLRILHESRLEIHLLATAQYFMACPALLVWKQFRQLNLHGLRELSLDLEPKDQSALNKAAWSSALSRLLHDVGNTIESLRTSCISSHGRVKKRPLADLVFSTELTATQET